MVESNNAINNTVGASITGVTNTLTVTNASDTASSAARQTITVGGASSGDPSLNFNVTGNSDWEIGIDNDEDDRFVISNSTSLGTSDYFRITENGERTLPLNPAFNVGVAAPIPNVTGNGTIYTVVYDTVKFDRGSNLSGGTTTFTAPVDGVYWFTFDVLFTNVQASHTVGEIRIVGGGDWVDVFSPANERNANDEVNRKISVLMSLTASDTVSTRVQISNGPLNVGIFGGAGHCFFCGHLAG